LRYKFAIMGHRLWLIYPTGQGGWSVETLPPQVWKELNSKEIAVLLPFVEKVSLESAKRLLDEIPIGVDWALVNQDAADWARSYSTFLAGQIDQTSRGAVATSIRNSVASFFEEGLTIGELEERLKRDPALAKLFTRDVRDRLGRIYGPTRAEMISVTEVTRAAAQGELAVAERLRLQGIDMLKIWQTNKDDVVCTTICEPLQGKDEEIWRSVAFEGPPAHPRCRCWLSLRLPKVKSD
jgi:hypothetical protein